MGVDSSAIEIIAASFDIVGKILIAFTAISVHYRVWKEHEINTEVFIEMKRERLIAFLGIFLMIMGYVLKVIGLMHTV